MSPGGEPGGPRGGEPSLVVLGAGARCSVARSAPQLAALARVDKADVRPAHLADAEGRAVPMALASRLPPEIRGLPRLIALAAPALREAVGAARRRTGRPFEAKIPVFLATPESARPDADPRRGRELLEALSSMTGVGLDLARSELHPLGCAGLAAALAAAAASLALPGAAEVALVGGADSHDHPDVIAWLDARGRRALPGIEGGLLPGEGAAFLLVARPSRRERESGEGLSPWLSTPATATDGLAAVRATMASSPVPPRRLFTQDDGDPGRREGWLLAARALGLPELDVETWPYFLGDAGAATGALFAAIADSRLRAAPAGTGPIALAFRSEDGLCGALVMGSPPARRGAHPPAGGAPTPIDPGETAVLPGICLGVLSGMAPVRGAERTLRAAALDATFRALADLAEAPPEDDPGGEELLLADAAVRAARAVSGRGARGARRDIVLRLASIGHHLGASLADSHSPAAARPVDRGLSRERPRADVEPAPGDGAPLSLRGAPSLRRAETSAWTPFSWLSCAPAQKARSLSDEELQIARACAETIERLRWQRALQPDSPWSPSLVDTEDRLLAHLDALFALCGEAWGVYPGAPEHDPSADLLADLFDPGAARRSGADPTFARALFLCSIDSDRAPRTAGMSLALLARRARDLSATRQRPSPEGRRPARPGDSPSSKDSRAISPLIDSQTISPVDSLASAHRLAFQLAPGPRIKGALEEALTGGDPAVLLVALDVLRARGEASFALLVPLSAHPDPAVRAAAVRAMARTPEPDVASGFLERLAFLHHPPEVALALADSLLRLDARAGLELARDQLLRRPTNGPATPPPIRTALRRLVALAGAAPDFRLLEGAREPEDIESVGWLGHAGAVDWLLWKLSEPAAGESEIASGGLEIASGGQEIAATSAAAEALHRLTGATAADLDAGAAAESPRRRAGDTPTDRDARGAAVLDPARWKAYWSRHRARLSVPHKLRHGQPITCAAVIDELLRPGVLQARRVTCAHELALMLPGVPLPEPDDWAARQISMLQAVRASEARGELRALHTPGDWPAARLGRRRAAL